MASRTMLNTGRFLWNSKKRTDSYKAIPKGEPGGKERESAQNEFWSRIMKSGGYTTYFTGKWHVGDGVKINPFFDKIGHVRGGMPPSVESAYNRPHEDAEDVWSPFDPQFKGHWTGGKHWAEVHAESSIRFIEDAAKKDEPFFMYLAFNSPHDPRQAPKEFVDMYPEKDMDVPDNFLPEYPYKDAMGCPASLRDERLAPFPRTEHAVRVHRREYYAIISHMDAQIGRILDALKKSGKRDNTYIFFTADNGLAVGSHGLFGKQSLFEHSVKVPLIVAGPNIPKDKRIGTPVYLQDIVPTSLELAGIEKPEHVQFKTLMPLIRGETTQHHHAIYGAYTQQQRMIRKDDFKLIVYPKGNTVLLFDLKKDPYEKTNLADEPEHAARVRDLFLELHEIREDFGDPLELPEK